MLEFFFNNDSVYRTFAQTLESYDNGSADFDSLRDSLSKVCETIKDPILKYAVQEELFPIINEENIASSITQIGQQMAKHGEDYFMKYWSGSNDSNGGVYKIDHKAQKKYLEKMKQFGLDFPNTYVLSKTFGQIGIQKYWAAYEEGGMKFIKDFDQMPDEIIEIETGMVSAEYKDRKFILYNPKKLSALGLFHKNLDKQSKRSDLDKTDRFILSDVQLLTHEQGHADAEEKGLYLSDNDLVKTAINEAYAELYSVAFVENLPETLQSPYLGQATKNMVTSEVGDYYDAARYVQISLVSDVCDLQELNSEKDFVQVKESAAIALDRLTHIIESYNSGKLSDEQLVEWVSPGFEKKEWTVEEYCSIPQPDFLDD